jgi:hypothetical protein
MGEKTIFAKRLCCVLLIAALVVVALLAGYVPTSSRQGESAITVKLTAARATRPHAGPGEGMGNGGRLEGASHL